MADKPENMRGTRETRTRRASNDATEPKQNPQSTSRHDAPPQSLASRVQSSAAGLARSAFQGAGSPDLAQTLAGATDGKAAGSSQLSSANAGASASYHASASARGSAAAQEQSGPVAESFRDGSTASSTQGGFALPEMTEDEFQRSYTGLEGASRERGVEEGNRSYESLQAEMGNWKGKQRAQDPVQREYTTAWERVQPPQSSHEQQPQLQPTDGEAVVSLLSDASFDPNFDPTENPDLDLADFPPPLSADEIKTLDSFRRQIGPSEPQNTQQQHLSSMSLVPDIDTFLQQNDPSAFTQTGDTATANISLRDTVLTHLPGAADWVGVQERYHDEVWGYLRPALEAAKEEMEEYSHGTEDGEEDGPAVRRLKMILKHMQA